MPEFLNVPVIVGLFMALDFATGTTQAVARRVMSSGKMREGLFHKTGLALCLMFGYLSDYAQGVVDLGYTFPVAASIAVWICAMETRSIYENLKLLNPELGGGGFGRIFGGGEND